MERETQIVAALQYMIRAAVQEALAGIKEPQKTAEVKPLSRVQAAKHLQISLPTLDRLLKSGRLKSSQIGRQKRIRLEDINEYLKGRA